MHRVPGTLLIIVFVLACSANLRPATDDFELTPRHGIPSKVILKGCHKLESMAVDFDGDGNPYQAQWWRCGSQNPNRKKGRFPINYVLIQPPPGKLSGSATLTNSGSSDEYFIEQLQKINIEPGPGSRQLLLVSGRYYDAEEGETSCLLGPVGEQFQCWPSDERERIVAENSHKREKSLFRRVDEFLSGQNLPY